MATENLKTTLSQIINSCQGMSVYEDRKIIILKSLQHYSDILASLLAKEALPEIVKFDLNNEYAKLYKVQSIVQTKGIFQKILEGHSA
jgi:hypothetical protein